MTLWEIRNGSIWVFTDGKHVGTIDRDQLPALILSAAKALKEG